MLLFTHILQPLQPFLPGEQSFAVSTVCLDFCVQVSGGSTAAAHRLSRCLQCSSSSLLSGAWLVCSTTFKLKRGSLPQLARSISHICRGCIRVIKALANVICGSSVAAADLALLTPTSIVPRHACSHTAAAVCTQGRERGERGKRRGRKGYEGQRQEYRRREGREGGIEGREAVSVPRSHCQSLSSISSGHQG